MHDPRARSQPARHKPRERWLPPRPGQRAGDDAQRAGDDAQRWRLSLRQGQRRRLAVWGGNLLLFALLIGAPLVRGRYRAQSTQRAYASFIACVYGVRVRGGLGAFAGETEYYAARLSSGDTKTLSRCLSLLDEVAPDGALFVLPWVKEREQHVREAVGIVRTELRSTIAHKSGARISDRPLRALRLLREQVRAQVAAVGLDDRQAELPVTLSAAPSLPAPARLPLYAAPDAALRAWGDDRALQIVGLDSTGLSYLGLAPGAPFTRARIARPKLLRGYARGDDQAWLVWSTAAARCAERADGCFGKTTRVALAPSPLLELPEGRVLAAHLAGRPDRTLAATATELLLASATAARRVQVQSFALAEEPAQGEEWPPLAPRAAWATPVDEAVVSTAAGQALALGVVREAARARLLRLDARASTELVALERAPQGAVESDSTPAWLSTCTLGADVSFAFGVDAQAVIGRLQQRPGGRWQASLWSQLPLAISGAIDPEDAQRDRVVSVCHARGVLVLVRDQTDELAALLCDAQQTSCKRLPIARDVQHFSAVTTTRGALLAYAGAEAPQVRVRTVDLERGELGRERVPAACFSRGGMCLRPTLARAGNRVVLLAPEKTDVLAIESADEGQSWSTLPL